MEDQVYFTPATRKYWVTHSSFLAELLEGMDFSNSEAVNEEDVISLPRNYFRVFTDRQWNLFKGLVEGDNSIFWFSSSGKAYINAEPEDLEQVLDYLLFDPDTMMKDLGNLARGRVAMRGTPAAMRQTTQLRARAEAEKKGRARAEAKRAGMPLRNYLEILDEERLARMTGRKATTRRAAKKFKKAGLGLGSNSPRRTTQKGKKGKGGKKNKTSNRNRNRKPSRFVERRPSNENVLNNFEEVEVNTND